jgi:hypothetical protein
VKIASAELSIEDLVDHSSAAVLKLMTAEGSGSGFLVTNTGVVVTNAHLVGTGNEVTVKNLPQQQFNGKVVYRDPAFPHIEEHMRPSTRKGYGDIWRNHIRPRCADVWLKNVRAYDVQQSLDSIAKPSTLGRNSLKHIKTFISAVFKMAKQQGYFTGENPVRDTAISPKAPAPQTTYAYSLDEIQSMLPILPERAAVALAVAYAGLRRGEVQGLLWENYQDGQIRVTRSVWRAM